MDRRGFLGCLAGAAFELTLGPEKLLMAEIDDPTPIYLHYTLSETPILCVRWEGSGWSKPFLAGGSARDNDGRYDKTKLTR